jgi:nucleotide-binding universal stress UspA family protein
MQMTGPIRTIVAGIATLDAEDSVLAAAVSLAQDLGATLHVMHVFDLPEPIQAAYQERMIFDPTLLTRYGRDLEIRLENRVRSLVGGANVICHVRRGAVSACLSELGSSIGADLLIVGAARRGRTWRHQLGSAAEGVIRASGIPVLVLRQPLPRDATRVLLTSDLSSRSDAVIARGVDLARALFPASEPEYRTLVVVHHDPESALPLRAEVMTEVATAELNRLLERSLRGEHTGAGKVRIGEPADEVLCEAWEWQTDLLVVGAHGRTGNHDFLLGSVAGATLRGASCNVLVIPQLPPVEEAADVPGRTASMRRGSRAEAEPAHPHL